MEKKQVFLRRGQAVGFDRLASGLLKPHLKKQGFAEPQLAMHWHTLVPHWASYAYPLKLSRQGVLVVAVVSDSVSQQMMMEKLQLLETINQFLGHAAVQDLRFKTHPHVVENKKPKKQIQPTEEELADARKKCTAVKDESLIESLARLGASIKKKEKK